MSRVNHNIQQLTSEEFGELRSDLETGKKINVEIDDREDMEHNGCYFVTGFFYNQHGRITDLGSLEEKDPEKGVHSSIEVLYYDGHTTGTIGIGLEPSNGEWPSDYRRRLERELEEGNVFDGSQEACDVLRNTYEEMKRNSWHDLELA